MGFTAESHPLVEVGGPGVVLLGVDEGVRRPPMAQPVQAVEDQGSADRSALTLGVDGEALEEAHRSGAAGHGVPHDPVEVSDAEPGVWGGPDGVAEGSVVEAPEVIEWSTASAAVRSRRPARRSVTSGAGGTSSR